MGGGTSRSKLLKMFNAPARMLAFVYLPPLALACFIVAGTIAAHAAEPNPEFRFRVSFPTGVSSSHVYGRVLLLLSTNDATEPRFQVHESGVESQQVFGTDVNAWNPRRPVIVDGSAAGYPVVHLSQVPPGFYYVQAVFNRYTTFHRADGHVVHLPMDEGEGQQWNTKPGNLISKPERVWVAPSTNTFIAITLTEKIPPIPEPRSKKWVKFVRIESPMLTKFWGRPMYLGAFVLLPPGWHFHPDAHYPLLVHEGHFPSHFSGFSTAPPPPGWTGMRKLRAEAAYRFYLEWRSGSLPHMLIVEIRHANPYGDDSYAVNSENIGPYGDAITNELIPYIEKKFRGIGQGWARATYGASTGGWEALASQIFHPDFYNGTWASCPDPVDFRQFQLVNIYSDKYALWTMGPWTRLPRGEMRQTDGVILTTMEDEQHRTNAIGSHGRSGLSMDLWQAVYSPVGSNGYPQPIWNPQTGLIDHGVADYWRDHYDLRSILQRNWKTLGPKLTGKIHIYVGTADTYYLNLAVKLLQNFMANTSDPHDAGDFHYGIGQPHGYTGDPGVPAAVGALTVTQRTLKKAQAWMLKTAPPGADTTSWRY